MTGQVGQQERARRIGFGPAAGEREQVATGAEEPVQEQDGATPLHSGRSDLMFRIEGSEQYAAELIQQFPKEEQAIRSFFRLSYWSEYAIPLYMVAKEAYI